MARGRAASSQEEVSFSAAKEVSDVVQVGAVWSITHGMCSNWFQPV